MNTVWNTVFYHGRLRSSMGLNQHIGGLNQTTPFAIYLSFSFVWTKHYVV